MWHKKIKRGTARWQQKTLAQSIALWLFIFSIKAEVHWKQLVRRTGGEKGDDYYKHWVNTECQQWCRCGNWAHVDPEKNKMWKISQSGYLCKVEVRGNYKRVTNQQRHAEAFLFWSSSEQHPGSHNEQHLLKQHFTEQQSHWRHTLAQQIKLSTRLDEPLQGRFPPTRRIIAHFRPSNVKAECCAFSWAFSLTVRGWNRRRRKGSRGVVFVTAQCLTTGSEV